MKKRTSIKTKLLTAISTAMVVSTLNAAELKPFPQEESHFGSKPSVTQSEMNQKTAEFYNTWKDNYLRAANSGGYYVHGADTDGHGKGTSESHGYGMLITVLMAGQDNQAKQYYDGLFSFFDTHRSSINPELMGWFINDNEDGTGTYSSAADGDLDIAYSLLLADKQWGSDGQINYRQEAIDMINKGLKSHILDTNSFRLMRGDWDNDKYSTRSSDWMTGHLSAFQLVTGDNDWDKARDEIYQMVKEINANHSNNTGLMPDFATGDPAYPNADDNTNESNAQHYAYNAARTPWRLAADYLHYGDARSQDISGKVVDFARTKVGETLNFDNYEAGYTVDGQSIGRTYSDITFIAPLMVAASATDNNQDFLDASWEYVVNHKSTVYFADSIKLLSMLAVSGNWWTIADQFQPKGCTSYVGSPHRIPGKIIAANYDNGENGQCYVDNDSENQGGEYRNDAIDIVNSGQDNIPYAIGYTEKGEFINYTVNVRESGTYSLRLQISSEQGGGALRLIANGKDVTGRVDLRKTGNWQRFRSVNLSGVQLEEGEQNLTVEVISPGFDLLFLRLTK